MCCFEICFSSHLHLKLIIMQNLSLKLPMPAKVRTWSTEFRRFHVYFIFVGSYMVAFIMWIRVTNLITENSDWFSEKWQEDPWKRTTSASSSKSECKHCMIWSWLVHVAQLHCDQDSRRHVPNVYFVLKAWEVKKGIFAIAMQTFFKVLFLLPPHVVLW